jgi:hypothetical protein
MDRARQLVEPLVDSFEIRSPIVVKGQSFRYNESMKAKAAVRGGSGKEGAAASEAHASAAGKVYPGHEASSGKTTVDMVVSSSLPPPSRLKSFQHQVTHVLEVRCMHQI